MAEMSIPPSPVSGSSSSALSPLSNNATVRSSVSRSTLSRFLIPREHGAWGMVSLPFIAGTLVAGGWANLRTFAATLAVFSIFLLRTPLQILWRHWAAVRKCANQNHGTDPRTVQGPARPDLSAARFSVVVYAAVAIVAGICLLLTVPLMPLLLIACGAAILTFAILFLAARNYQRYPALQIASAIGLTASSLPAYLAAHGHLDSIAFWIWLLCAVESSAAVLVVHARLEAIVVSRKSVPSPLPHRRHALLAQVGLCIFLAALAAQGRSWLILPFIPTCMLHWWDLWQLGATTRRRVSMQRVGVMQLTDSIAFCSILIAVLRFSSR